MTEFSLWLDISLTVKNDKSEIAAGNIISIIEKG
jgi:hypothetical protein